MTSFVQDAKTGKWSIPKDPDAVLDYVEDWTEWLNAVGDLISTCLVTATSSLTPASNVAVNSYVIDGTSKKVHAWISGGTDGETVTVRYRVNTPTRTDYRTCYLKIKKR